jgi:hypothetical protein
MSFLRTYVSPEYYKEGGNAGLTAVKSALGKGMSINDILAASRNQGFGFGSSAQNFIDSSPEFFKKFVNSGSTTHAGLSAIEKAEAAGMSLDQIRSASRNQGFSFGAGAQKYMDTPDFFRKYVNSGSTTHAGLTAVQKARADGMSVEDLIRTSNEQGFQFASGARSYLNDERYKELTKKQDDFLNNLRIEQDARLNKIASDQRLSERTFQSNQARSNQMGALQIAGSSETPRTGGTQGFKRRKLQINPVTANALAGILGGTNSQNTTNTLNV